MGMSAWLDTKLGNKNNFKVIKKQSSFVTYTIQHSEILFLTYPCAFGSWGQSEDQPQYSTSEAERVKGLT